MSFESNITQVSPAGFVLRGSPLAGRIGTESVAATALLAWKGVEPSWSQVNLFDALLVAWADAGILPPSTRAARYAASGGASLNAAVAAGLLAQGEHHAPISAVARILSSPAAPESIVASYGTHRVPGFGHPLWNENDARADRVLAVARQEGFNLKYWDRAEDIGVALSKAKGRLLRPNMAALTAAMILELGLSPEHGDGVFVLGRTVGLVAHVVEERSSKKKCKIS